MFFLPLLILGAAVAGIGYAEAKKKKPPTAVVDRPLPLNLVPIPSWATSDMPIEVEWPDRPSWEGVTLVVWAYAEIVQALRQRDPRIVTDLAKVFRDQTYYLEADFLLAAAHYLEIV